MMECIDGVRLAAGAAGIKSSGKTDVVLIEVAEGANIVGVFTQNAFCAAPVSIAKKHIADVPSRYLLINSGNANCGTGQAGFDAAIASCQAVADLTACHQTAVLPFSTGVIGELLPHEKIQAVLPDLINRLDENAWMLAAEGIMTTDTYAKLESVTVKLSQGDIKLVGISKGAGMIKPDMATMLAYIATDACIDSSLLQQLISEASEKSFNRVTVDGDTSTNDACILIATGKQAEIVDATKDYDVFKAALNALCLKLAQKIIRDGEGATKFVEVNVSGGLSSKECLAVAYTVAESPLVKTALFASDPNWGRILAAVGRAGVTALDVNRVNIRLNTVPIVTSGERDASYTEEAGQAAMSCKEIIIEVELNRGLESESVWTTDFSHEYVTINAEYRS